MRQVERSRYCVHNIGRVGEFYLEKKSRQERICRFEGEVLLGGKVEGLVSRYKMWKP